MPEPRKLTDEEIAEAIEEAWAAGQCDIWFEKSKWGFASPTFIIREIHPNRQSYRLATGFTWTEPISINQPAWDAAETFRLDPQVTQDLFDQMWKSGFRPSDPKGALDAQTHDALKAHLADMRNLALNTLMPMIKGVWDAPE